MTDNLKKILLDGINKIDSSLVNDKVINLLVRLYDEISLFNPKYALVNAQEQDLVIRHILDSLAPVPIIKNLVCKDNLKMADLGSGAGLPGLVLASAFPLWDITLVERMNRRAGFLRNTIAMMGLNKNVKVLQKDLSEVHEHFDVITFRAFRPFKDIIADLDRILDKQGKIIAYKSSEENIQEEINVLSSYNNVAFSSKIFDYKVPMLDSQRRLLVVSRAL